MILWEKIFDKAQEALAAGDVAGGLRTDAGAVYSEEWVDVGGAIDAEAAVGGFVRGGGERCDCGGW